MWISVHTSIDGGKLRKLRKELHCSKFEATGILNYLWMWGLENAEKDGSLPYVDIDDIRECITGKSAGCTIPPEKIVDALISTGWIDRTDIGYALHDWEEWQDQWYKAKARREADTERKRKKRTGDIAEDEHKHQVTEPQNTPQEATEATNTNLFGEQQEASKGKKDRYSEGFIKMWEVYPRKIDKGRAYKCYIARRNDGFSEDELFTAAKNYAAYCKKQHTQQEYIKHASTFFGPTLPFEDYLPKKKPVAVSVNSNSNPFSEWGDENE